MSERVKIGLVAIAVVAALYLWFVPSTKAQGNTSDAPPVDNSDGGHNCPDGYHWDQSFVDALKKAGSPNADNPQAGCVKTCNECVTVELPDGTQNIDQGGVTLATPTGGTVPPPPPGPSGSDGVITRPCQLDSSC